MAALPVTWTTPDRCASTPGDVMRTPGLGQAGGRATAVGGGGGGGGVLVTVGPRGGGATVTAITLPPLPRNGVGVGAAGVGDGGSTVAVGVINTARSRVGERCGVVGTGRALVSAK